eukprot:gene11392-7897_t
MLLELFRFIGKNEQTEKKGGGGGGERNKKPGSAEKRRSRRSNWLPQPELLWAAFAHKLCCLSFFKFCPSGAEEEEVFVLEYWLVYNAFQERSAHPPYLLAWSSGLRHLGRIASLFYFIFVLLCKIFTLEFANVFLFSFALLHYLAQIINAID